MHQLTVQVLHNGNPVRGKEVTCLHERGGIFGSNSHERTDEEGMAEFDNVPDGNTDIYIDGRKVDEVYFAPYDIPKSRTVNI